MVGKLWRKPLFRLKQSLLLDNTILSCRLFRGTPTQSCPLGLNDTWACSSMWNDLKTSLIFDLTYQSHIGPPVIKRQANQLLNKFSRRRWKKIYIYYKKNIYNLKNNNKIKNNRQSFHLPPQSQFLSFMSVIDWGYSSLKLINLEKIARAHIWKDWFESVTVYLACPLVFSGYFLPLLSCPIRPI